MAHSTAHKVVILTGGSRGLGLAIIKKLLASNYYVISCSRSETPDLSMLMEQYPSQLYWVKIDIGQEEERERLFQQSMSWINQHPSLQGEDLYALINNAGIAKEGILATFPIVESETIIETNLTAPISLCRHFIRQKLSTPSSGRIINISSIIASHGYTGLSSYAASKAGLEGLTRSLARELGRRDITVNAIAPGYLETDMSTSLSEQKRQQIIRRTPLQRLGQCEDITPMINMLLSKDTNFITGQVFTVDGGINC